MWWQTELNRNQAVGFVRAVAGGESSIVNYGQI